MKTPYSTGQGSSQRSSRSAGWLHWGVILLVFSITGTLSVVFSQFLLHSVLNLEGGIWSGPWSYRIAYLALVPPFYSITLVAVGTLFGKHQYFKARALSLWSVLLLRPFYRRITNSPR